MNLSNIKKEFPIFNNKNLVYLDSANSSQKPQSVINRINDFVKSMKYDPNLNLHDYADNLYNDVGEVASTLIRLRYSQAENSIKKLLQNND